ncbi:uncharacterized protein LOC128558123 [Mercenaria mercenaria]|uniref:uncharacterized protein LOC128558123 n=1 Tax=Mercenaria mercenaria TaxID=6596 RepID=UPI00234E9CC2|nr:uncharacterized protein LOC128558123 [Mercenaria mercenaria]
MSSQINARKRVKYNPQSMAVAIQMVRSGQMSKRGAAKAYGVPKSTLLDKLTGRTQEIVSLGRKTVLTPAEEKALVSYANLMCEIGYPITRKELTFEVQRILNIDGRDTPFKCNLPGKDWFSGFQKRHPEMTFRKPMALGHERAAVTMEKINNWYTGVYDYLQTNFPDTYKDMLKDPRRIINADESGFPLSV